MVKRVTITALWFFGAWTPAALTVYVLGAPDVLVPVCSVAAACAAWVLSKPTSVASAS
jgi:hypothetical protein